MSKFRQRFSISLEVVLATLFLLSAVYATHSAVSRPCFKPYCDDTVSPLEFIFGDKYDIQMYNKLVINNLEPWFSIGSVAGIFAVALFVGNIVSKRRKYLVWRGLLITSGLLAAGYRMYLTAF